MPDYVLYNHNQLDQIVYHYAKTDTCDVDIHLHDFYEIFMALSDNIKYFIEGQVYDLLRGDVIITNHLEVHRPQVIDSQPYERRYIQFRPQIFSQLLGADYNPLRIFTQRALGIGNKISLSTITSEPVSAVMKSFDRMDQLQQKNNGKSHLLIYSEMLQLLVNLDELYEPLGQPMGALKEIDPRIQKILILIDSSYPSKISISNLCATLYVDPYYMSHLFKKTTGFSITEYIQSKRIQLAKKLIIEGAPITQVCYLCGFDDYSNFYKTFKKLVKLSPKEYKDNVQ